MIRYLIVVSICWVVLYLVYHAFLRKETFFHINRGYLLSSLVLGALIPAYQWIPTSWYQDSAVVVQYVLPIQSITIIETGDSSETWSWLDVALAAYIVGVVAMLARLANGLLHIRALYRSGESSETGGLQVIYNESVHLPFSFWQTVYISKAVPLRDEMESILKHEAVHIRSWHSIDVLLVEVLHALYWFNPILILYRQALQQSHEYVADAIVIKDIPRKIYSHLLLQQAQAGLEMALVNSFFHAQIKTRIQMMYQEKSKRPALVKYLAIVPVLAALLLVFSCESPETVEQTTSAANPSEFNGKPRLIIDGRESYGSIEDISPDIIEQVDVLKGQAAIDKYGKGTSDGVIEITTKRLVTVDGVPTDRSLNQVIADEDTHYITIMDAGNAITKYGDKGRYGTYEVSTLDEHDDMGTGESRLFFEGITIVFVPKDKDPLVLQNTKDTYPRLRIDGREVMLDRPIRPADLPADITDLQMDKSGSGNGISGTLSVTTSKTSPTKTDTPVSSDDQIFKNVEVMPMFPGCDDTPLAERRACAEQKMLEYIYGNLKYPADARDNGVEGMAVLQFVIDQAGQVTSPKVIRPLHPSIDAEVLRLIRQMSSEKTWSAGKENGKAVKVLYTLPIRFKLQG